MELTTLLKIPRREAFTVSHPPTEPTAVTRTCQNSQWVLSSPIGAITTAPFCALGYSHFTSLQHQFAVMGVVPAAMVNGPGNALVVPLSVSVGTTDTPPSNAQLAPFIDW